MTEAAYLRRLECEAGRAPEPKPFLYSGEVVEWWAMFVLRAFGHSS